MKPLGVLSMRIQNAEGDHSKYNEFVFAVSLMYVWNAVSAY